MTKDRVRQLADLEITRLCAEAMGYTILAKVGPQSADPSAIIVDELRDSFRPLHDDEQAMALVKRFRLNILSMRKPNPKPKEGALAPVWRVSESPMRPHYYDADLCRAICLCVAALQSSKQEG